MASEAPKAPSVLQDSIKGFNKEELKHEKTATPDALHEYKHEKLLGEITKEADGVKDSLKKIGSPAESDPKTLFAHEKNMQGIAQFDKTALKPATVTEKSDVVVVEGSGDTK